MGRKVEGWCRWRTLAMAALLLCPALPSPAAGRPACRREVERVERGTWTSSSVTGLAGAAEGWRMDVDEGDPRLVVVADHAGVLVSRDGGCSWERTATFAEVSARWPLRAEDVAVLTDRGRRSVHVLLVATAGAGPGTLLSSTDDGRTWRARDLPPELAAPPLQTAALEVGGGGTLFVLTLYDTGTGGVFSTRDSGTTWHWKALTTTAFPEGLCTPEGTCTSPPLRSIAPDPGNGERLWGLTTERASSGAAVVRSADGGSAWTELAAPALLQGPALMDVAPARRGDKVLLLGRFGDFALSRDDGVTWEVGEFPQLSSGSTYTSQSFDAAHTSDGKTFATLPGQGRGSAWAGNVMLFDGTEWRNVAPEAYAGYARKDEAGRALWFTELTGTRGSYVMLSSLGRLATFRPAR